MLKKIIAFFIACVYVLSACAAFAEQEVCVNCDMKLKKLKTEFYGYKSPERDKLSESKCRFDLMVDIYERVFLFLLDEDAASACMWYDALKDMAEYPVFLEILEKSGLSCGTRLDYYMIARSMEAEGSRSEAINYYRLANILDSHKRIEDMGMDAQYLDRYNLAKKYFDNGQYADALKIFKELGTYRNSETLADEARRQIG